MMETMHRPEPENYTNPLTGRTHIARNEQRVVEEIGGERVIVIGRSGAFVNVVYAEIATAHGMIPLAIGTPVTVRDGETADQCEGGFTAILVDGQWYDGRVESFIVHPAGQTAWRALEAAGIDETALLP